MLILTPKAAFASKVPATVQMGKERIAIIQK
jgi:hypothetical protein